jgi:hypothetical protein
MMPDVSEQEAGRVETFVRAPMQIVREALTEPLLIRRWFGWDDQGLDPEIGHIFVERDPGIALEKVPGGTHVSVGALGDGSAWNAIDEGWRMFFEQLRYALEVQALKPRRTVHLDGTAAPALVLAGTDGEPWHEATYQRGVLDGDELVIVSARDALTGAAPTHTTVTVTTYDLDAAEFAVVHERWASWWRSIAQDPVVVPRTPPTAP